MNAEVIKRNDNACQVHSLLADIQDLQVEKEALKQKIKCKNLQRKKEKLCQYLQKINVRKDDEDQENALKLWCKEIDCLMHGSGSGFAVTDTTFYAASLTEDQTQNASAQKLLFSFLYKGYLMEIKITETRLKQPLASSVTEGDNLCDVLSLNKVSNNDCEDNGEKSCFEACGDRNGCSFKIETSIFVNGLEDCVRHHLTRQSSFEDMFVVLVACLENDMIKNV